MPPDLNSLPPSRSMSSSPMQTRQIPISPPNRNDTPSPRSASVSLAAAATINAADLSRRSSISNNRGSPRLGRMGERRRSIVAMTLNLNDPTTPSSGELLSNEHRTSIGHSYMSASPSTLGGIRTLSDGDPHHQRAPSLGEIHQELEQEQEAQVNRMLQLIRQQQQQLDQMQRSQQESHSRNHSGTAVLDDHIPTLEQSPALASSTATLPALTRPSRRFSRGAPSGSPSPRLRPSHGHETGHSSSGEWPPSPIDIVRRNSLRDESTYFQAETASLTRENQMLRQRIRDLERQVSDMSATQAHTPPIRSNLASSPSVENQLGEIGGSELSDANKP